ncbi:hypothetical protein [Burkholderia sp. S171]|uniref:hypothetical protein n=1 Tax=Burkholderia sp. S171 TaxID=1641860 RepID=UPI00131E0292|nr:hypothetical protein [Burkholderia sp. S171]
MSISSVLVCLLGIRPFDEGNARNHFLLASLIANENDRIALAAAYSQKADERSAQIAFLVNDISPDRPLIEWSRRNDVELVRFVQCLSRAVLKVITKASADPVCGSA